MKTKTPATHKTLLFAGDSGDGIQVIGSLFASISAKMGNDVHTLADFPAEIRAPAGSLSGVSGFQLKFSAYDAHTPGDLVDILVVLNPAALKTKLASLKQGGLIIANIDGFNDKNLRHAAYTTNPLTDNSLQAYQVFSLPMTTLTREAVKTLDISHSQASKCKNMFTLGAVACLLSRELNPAIEWLNDKFKKQPIIAEANITALQAGYDHVNAIDAFAQLYSVGKAGLPAGRYRQITGNEAIALGCIAATEQVKAPLLLSTYPITPASSILHELSHYQHANVQTLQAEDEIAAIGAALGAAYGGSLGITTTSGPGFDLVMETVGLAIMAELPLVIVDVQRSGPSTGMPTKTEQTDLLMALYGRHGESPIPVVAAATPSDCFAMLLEAFRIALDYMTPVVLLSDAFLASSSEPWLLPDVDSLPKLKRYFKSDTLSFNVANRDLTTLAREWAVPGMKNCEHRIGGLEKDIQTGKISYDPNNHQRMTHLRAQKVAGIAKSIPPLEILGAETGELLVIGWGSTYGSILTAIEQLQADGLSIGFIHLKHLNPWPKNLSKILKGFNKVLVIEMNHGQLCKLLRAEFLVDAVSYSRVTGKPFSVNKLKLAMLEQIHEVTYV